MVFKAQPPLTTRFTKAWPDVSGRDWCGDYFLDVDFAFRKA
jgi:hypothetical protein